MSRSQRLFDLIQLMRQQRRPVGARHLAEVLGVSLRTLYRDIDALRAQGADIGGEAGIGYVLRPGFLLPPLMFTEDEVEALVFGSRWVAEHADADLAGAAGSALAKIRAVLPAGLVLDADASPLLVGPVHRDGAAPFEAGALRAAMLREHKIRIAYRDQHGEATARLVWPIALGHFNALRILVAWCELRQGFRHFRLDRIRSLTVLDERYPRRRRVLMQEWRAQEHVNAADRN